MSRYDRLRYIIKMDMLLLLHACREYVGKYFILLLASINWNIVRAEIPIIAFIGVPPNCSDSYRFREFREAGFDVSLYDYADMPLDQLKTILNTAWQEKVRVLVGSNLLYKQSGKFIEAIKNHPALFGYFIMDEPNPDQLHIVSSRYVAIRKHDKQTMCYMNLHPNLGAEQEKYFKMGSYTEYLKKASHIDLPQISFDIYPITTDSVRTTWYPCLEDVRHESLRSQKPFWAFVLSTPHSYYPKPTISSLRLQIYSNLAYGAKAIQYFTYWTPDVPGGTFHNGPIDINGKPTDTYQLVKRMNKELRGIIPLFDGSTVTSVNHMIHVPYNGVKMKRPPLNVRRLKVKGYEGAIVSVIEKNDKVYMVVVNKDLMNSMQLIVKANKNVKYISKMLQEMPLIGNYTVPAGDIVMFRLK